MGWNVVCVYIIDAPRASWDGNWENGTYARAHDAHHGAATPTGEWRAVLDPGQGPLRVEAEQILKQGHQAFAVGVQEAEVARTPEAFGQHMLEDEPQEAGAGDGSELELLGLAVQITKGHLAVLAGDDISLLEHPFIEIAPQIDQRLLAGADGLYIHDPGLGVACGQLESLLADGLEQLGPKDLGQGLVVEQIAGLALAASFPAALGPPALLFTLDGARGALELLVVFTKHPHALPAAEDHQGIEHALMLPSQWPELLGQGEGQEKILGGHLFLELTFQPLLALMVLAVRTVAMAAGVGHQNLAVALGALC